MCLSTLTCSGVNGEGVGGEVEGRLVFLKVHNVRQVLGQANKLPCKDLLERRQEYLDLVP